MHLLFSIFFCTLYTLSVWGQNTWDRIKVDSNLNDSLFTQRDSVYNPLTLVTTDSLGIVHFDGVPDSNKYEVGSNCLIKNHWSPTLLFCQAHINYDTLVIIIYEGNPAESKSVTLRIINNNFSMNYSYDTPFPVERTFKTISQNLVLKDIPNLKSGEIVFGKIYLMVQMNEEGNNSEIQIEGAFKCRIIE